MTHNIIIIIKTSYLPAPVEYRWHVSLWVPESKGGHEDPDDGYLVQQLTHEAECAVEVDGPETHDHQKCPHNVDSSTDTAGVGSKEIDEDRRYDEEQGIADLEQETTLHSH